MPVPCYSDECKDFAPLNSGELLQFKYVLKREVGQGNFAAVWLAEHRHTKKPYILKIFGFSRRDIAEMEIETLEKISAVKDAHPTTGLVDFVGSFDLKKKHRYKVIVFSDLGQDILHTMKTFYPTGFPIAHVKNITRQLLTHLHYLHSRCKFIHTDLKLENILRRITDSELNAIMDAAKGEIPTRVPEDYDIVVCDMGACYDLPCRTKDIIQPPAFQAPEAVFELRKYGPPVDVWSAACVIFQLLTADKLFFARQEIDTEEYSDERQHVYNIMRLAVGNQLEAEQLDKLSTEVQELSIEEPSNVISKPYANPFTSEMLKTKRGVRYFDDDGFLIYDLEFKPDTIYNRLMSYGKLSEEEANEVADFLVPMLEIDPDKRATIPSLLKHAWLN